jgi:putative peptidoglycan lipid II flippase
MTDGGRGVAGDSATIAVWTTVSRLTGFGRGAVLAAVLGPTYFGNTFQATNILPNLTYELLTGSLFASLLMPHLVRHVDSGDDERAKRIAGGFLGVAMIGFVVLVVAAVAAGPLLLRLLTLGVTAEGVAEDQRRVGLILMAMLMPQVVLYGIAGTSGAVLNARGKFALAAAAPAFENLGMMITLGVSAWRFGTAPDLATVTVGELLLLGIGTTAAVGLHAGALWYGTWRVGLPLRPRAGWRDDEVRALLRQVLPSLGYAGLNVVRLFGILVVANRVPGGVVAFQLALNFFHLPVAVGARPVAVALLPRLARLSLEQALAKFRDELVRGMAMSLFITVPAAAAYVALAGPLAAAVALGEMANPTGRHLVAVSLAALGVGVVGEALFVLSTHAAYARQDATSPFLSSVLRTGIVLCGMAIALTFTGTTVLLALGLTMSASNLAAAAHLGTRVARALPPGDERLGPSALRAVAASALMTIPAYFVATSIPLAVPTHLGRVLGVAVAAIVGGCVFLGAQRAWHAPELHWIQSRSGPRTGQ